MNKDDKTSVSMSEDTDSYSIHIAFIKRKELSDITKIRIARVCSKILKVALG